MAKTKNIIHHCDYCRQDTKMEFVGSQPSNSADTEATKAWYRCCKCKHSALLTIIPSSQTKKSQAAPIDREQCTPYSKDKTFSVGEHIYHTEWDDVGRVIRKDKMSNGVQSIVVSFEKVGERKLLECIQEEPENIVENEAV